MFLDIASFFYNNVISAYQNYTSKRDGSHGCFQHTRAAVELASALFHFREYLPKNKSRSQVESECSAYRLIADIANVSKHRALSGQTPQGRPLVDNIEQIQECAISVTYEDDMGKYFDASTSVIIKCTDGIDRNLDDALIDTLNYWSDELRRDNSLNLPIFTKPRAAGSCFVSRSDARTLNLSVTQGIGAQFVLVPMIYNSEKGYAEPIDLTGATAELRIYEPIRSINLTLTHNSGEQIQIPIELTDEESRKFHLISSEEEAREFFESLGNTKKKLIDAKIAEAIRARDPH